MVISIMREKRTDDFNCGSKIQIQKLIFLIPIFLRNLITRK